MLMLMRGRVLNWSELTVVYAAKGSLGALDLPFWLPRSSGSRTGLEDTLSFRIKASTQGRKENVNRGNHLYVETLQNKFIKSPKGQDPHYQPTQLTMAQPL